MAKGDDIQERLIDNESGIWLEIIRRGEMLSLNRVEPLAKECMELSRIISASIRTVGKK